MDSIFQKFQTYDFMGVWAPGAIFCAYCNFSFYSKLQFLFRFGTWSYILLYIAIAYLLGVIFHEVGKFAMDVIKPFFDLDKYGFPEKLKLKSNKNSHWFLPRSFQYKYRKTLLDCDALPMVPFYKAYSELKYAKDVSLQRVNTYHSVYALSRGILIGIVAHIFLSFILHPANYIYYILVDTFLVYVFFCRTVRYFISWVMNVFIQYKILSNKGIKNESIS